MVNVNVVGGYDGVTFPAGLTDQSTTSTMDIGAALESAGGGNALGYTNPLGNAYLAWTQTPEDSTSNALAMTSTSGWLTRLIAQTGGPCAHMDLNVVSGTYTNAVFAIYNAAAFAVGPLVWTADQHANMSVGIASVTWNGASSPSSLNLVAGQTYWVYTEITGTSPVLGGVLIANAAVANANLTASASFANNAMTLGAAAPTSIASNTTLAPQTSWANTNVKPWFGLRA